MQLTGFHLFQDVNGLLVFPGMWYTDFLAVMKA